MILSPFKEEARTNALLIFNTFSLYFIVKKYNEINKIRLQKTILIMTSLFLLFSLLIEIYPSTPYPREEFFLKSNFIGSLSILGLFFSLSFYNDIKIFSLIILCCALASFYFTESFAGLLGVSVGLIYLTRNINKNEKNQRILFLFLTLCLMAGILFFLSHWRMSSINDRVRWWKAAFEIAIQYPFFGSGPGSFEKVSPIYLEPGLKSLYVHNFFLQNICEIGTLATTFLFYFIFKELKNSSNLILKIGLISVFTQCLLDYSLNVPGFFLLFFLILASISEPIKDRVIQRKKNLIITFYSIFFPFILFFGWELGIKPLVSFNYSLKAKESYQKENLPSAEKFLRSALKWDDLPLQHYLSLSHILQIQYNKNSKKSHLLKERQNLQKIILDRNPYIFYKNQEKINGQKR